MPNLHIYKNEKETCKAFAEWMAELVKETLRTQDRFTVAFSGNDIPKILYKILSTDFADKMDWSKIHVFWGDENLASLKDEKNNERTALRMFIEQVPIRKEQVHAMKTDIDLKESAKQYDRLLHNYFDDQPTTFDLVVLGMSEQGNILSLLPGSDENINRDEWVVPVYAKQEDLFKITLTIPIINASAAKAFLLTGKNKMDIVHQVLKGKYEPEKYLAQLIQTKNKTVHWFLDEGAADKLIKLIS